MAHLEVSFSSVIKESQAATEALGKIEQAISGTVPAFDAAKQVTIPKGTEKIVDLTSYKDVTFVAIKVLTGKPVRLRLRKAAREASDMKVPTFFAASVQDVDKIGIVATETDATILLQVTGT